MMTPRAQRQLLIQHQDGRYFTAVRRPLHVLEVDTVWAFHQSLVRSLPLSLVARDPQAFFAHHAGPEGIIDSLWLTEERQPAQLIAYAVLGLPHPHASNIPNLGPDHGFEDEQITQVAHLDGAGVAPEFRGNRIQFHLTLLRLLRMRALGRRWALATAAPDNVFSVSNLLRAGLSIRGLAPRHGGMRFLFQRDLHKRLHASEQGHWVLIHDYERQSQLIAQGHYGWRLRRAQNTGAEIWFAPPI